MVSIANKRLLKKKKKKDGNAAQTWDPGFGVLHFLMLQTVLNEKLIFPHFGHVQSLSRVTSRGAFFFFKKKGRKTKLVNQ